MSDFILFFVCRGKRLIGELCFIRCANQLMCDTSFVVNLGLKWHTITN